jgi:hypothetical protein
MTRDDTESKNGTSGVSAGRPYFPLDQSHVWVLILAGVLGLFMARVLHVTRSSNHCSLGVRRASTSCPREGVSGSGGEAAVDELFHTRIDTARYLFRTEN